jgi:hypothetical protein
VPPPPRRSGHAGRADRWYHHVAPATALVECEGEQHTITWRWGKLKLDDHDLGSERAMLVLGGAASACLRALQLWGEQFGMRPDQFEEMRRRLGADAGLAPKELDVPREVGMTLSLERAWRRSVYLDEQGRLIERQLRARAMPALRASLTAEKQRFGSRVLRTVVIRHVPAGRPPAVTGQMDRVSVSATVTLSSNWLVRVWPRGLGVVDGSFVLDVIGPGQAPGTVSVQLVKWVEVAPGVAEPAVVEAEVPEPTSR